MNQPDRSDALDVLAKVGGLEIAGLVGLILGAASGHKVVVVDGFIATAELCPAVRGYLIAAHRSVETGHRVALERLELEPLFALDLRLGEGSGAALAVPIIDAALAVLVEMATFEGGGIAGALTTKPEQGVVASPGTREFTTADSWWRTGGSPVKHRHCAATVSGPEPTSPNTYLRPEP